MKNIPVLHVVGKSLAETYEKALVELYKNGCRFKTQYDKPDDPESIDATMNLTIEEPMTDPMIHKYFPGSIADLREYVMELKGAKNHWTKNLNDPKDTRWEYTYNSRLTNYGQWKEKDIYGLSLDKNLFKEGNGDKINIIALTPINQIEVMINKLIEQPFTRRAQAITWMPTLDNDCYDPPCLQSLWARITEDGGEKYLNTNIRFRSNDANSAYAMNAFGLTMFIKESIMDEIAKRTGWNIKMGRINWQADSWHIYGKDIEGFKNKFLNRLNTTTFEERVYNFYDPDIQEMYVEAETMVVNKIAEYDKAQNG